MRRVVYVDTETAGGKAAPDSLLEVALVGEAGETLFHSLVDPGRPIDPWTTRVHGITDAMVAGRAPPWAFVAPWVAAILADAEMVAHNARFDHAVLGEAAAGVARLTCTLALCRARLGRPLRLALAAAEAGFAPTGPWHRALADALACRAVHRHLLPLPDLDAAARRAARRAATEVATATP